MGVTRCYDELEPIKIETIDNFNYADFDLSERESTDEEEKRDEMRTHSAAVADAVSRSKKNKERRQDRRTRQFVLQMETDGMRVRSGMGARKWRRLQHARDILSYTEKDEICTDYSDLLPQSYSSFHQLFTEKENMRTWNEFIKKDEAVQRKIVSTGEWTEEPLEGGKEDGWFVVGGKDSPIASKVGKGDSRQHHPAYSAKACFDRLDSRCKTLINRRNVQWAFVDFLERQLREFFENGDGATGGVYVGNFANGHDRAIAHTVAQFLRLSSKSVTEPKSMCRLTEIRNGRPFFVPARETLVSFLAAQRPEGIDFVPWDNEGNPVSDLCGSSRKKLLEDVVDGVDRFSFSSDCSMSQEVSFNMLDESGDN